MEQSTEDVSRVLTDEELDGVVGGMAALTSIGIALSLFRIFQAARNRSRN